MNARGAETAPAAMQRSPSQHRSLPGDQRLWAWGLLLVLMAVALGLRLPGFDWWLNPDEATYYQVATASPAVASRMIAENAHPPLYYRLLRLLAPFDSDFVLLRMPSMLAGLLLVPATYLLGLSFGGRIAGVAAAALVALSPGGINLAALMRPYSAQVLLIAIGIRALIAYQENERRGALVAYGTCMAVALFLQYGTIVVVGGVGLALVVLFAAKKLSRRQVIDLGLAHLALGGVVAYLYFTHIATSLMGGTLQSLAREGWLQRELSSEISMLPWRVREAAYYALGPRLGNYAGALAVMGLLVLAFQKRLLLAVLPLSILAVASVLALRELYPLGMTRHSFYLLPFFACTAGAAVAWLARGWTRWPLLAGLVLFVATDHGASSRKAGEFTLPEHHVRRSEVQAVAEFMRQAELDDAVLLTDQQTLQIMRTIPGLAHGDPPPASTLELQYETLGERLFAVSFHWRLQWNRGTKSEASHLVHFLDLLERTPRWGERLQADPVYFFQGGWGVNPVRAGDSDAPTVFSEHVGGPGFGASRLDLERYRGYLAGDE